MDLRWISTFHIASLDSPDEALPKIARLLEEEYVEFEIERNAIRSTRTPVTFVNIDRRNFSRLNWVGMNPFVYVTGIEVEFHPEDPRGAYRLIVDRTRLRILMGSVLLLLICPISLAIPMEGIPILFAFWGLVFLWFRYLSGELIRNEIAQALSRPL